VSSACEIGSEREEDRRETPCRRGNHDEVSGSDVLRISFEQEQEVDGGEKRCDEQDMTYLTDLRMSIRGPQTLP
jgi:hypothetical protein